MIKLLNADCMNIKLPKCRLLLTDIPYDTINRSDNGLRNLNKGNADIATFEINDFLNHIYDAFDICIIFCSREQLGEISHFFNKKNGITRQIVWCKTNPSPMNGEYTYLSSIENAIFYKKKNTGKLNCKCKKSYFCYPCGKSKLTPTQKPIGLFKELILDTTNENDLVIDTCMGSGTTGIACKELNRDFIGIEIDKNTFDIATQHINNSVDK